MIYCLTGVILEKTLEEVIIECAGVGYRVFVPQTAHSSLEAVGSTCTLFTYLNVKEDALDLYGFASKDEQRSFKILTSVSGVGPKAGLAILSALSPSKIAIAISSGDFKAFTSAQGIGPKIAQRIVLELKDKFKQGSIDGVSIADISSVRTSESGNVSQAVSALVALGYTQSQAVVAVSKLDDTLDVQSLIKQGLRLIAGGKV